jgi:hypothetical protein
MKSAITAALARGFEFENVPAPMAEVTPPRESTPIRQFRCVICGKIKSEPEFWTYWNENGENLGKCKFCQ